MTRSRFVPFLLALALVAGCSGKQALVALVPPQTTLFVQGPVDTVNHIVHLYWFGSDVDGTVTGFELRLLNPSAPADSAWIGTARTDSLFTVYTPTGVTSPRFEVRAVDNDNLRDPTPAVELFHLDNQPPVVTFGPYPQIRDTTYASLTTTFNAADPDGEAKKMRFRVWLDGNEASAHIVNGSPVTIPTSDFVDAGSVRSGVRTVFVQPIDDGGLAGEIVSRSWVVRPTTINPLASRARLLLIDDVPNTNVLNVRDSLWFNAVASTFADDPGSWSILKLEFTNPFRSVADVAQTFSLYDAVVWYRGTQSNFSTTLSNYQDGVDQALTGGHSFMVEGLNLVDGLGHSGPLSQGFVSKWFDTDYLYKYFQSGMVDSSVEWGIQVGRVFRSGPALASEDSLRMAATFAGLRGFAVRDTANVLLWARGGTLSQPHDFDIPVALLVTHGPTGTRAGIISLPLVAASAGNSSFPQRATAFVNKVLSRLRKSGT